MVFIVACQTTASYHETIYSHVETAGLHARRTACSCVPTSDSINTNIYVNLSAYPTVCVLMDFILF